MTLEEGGGGGVMLADALERTQLTDEINNLNSSNSNTYNDNTNND